MLFFTELFQCLKVVLTLQSAPCYFIKKEESLNYLVKNSIKGTHGAMLFSKKIAQSK